ncbi:MAG TPA: hypothetical protein VJZ71_08705 [Phycisphaerae bacterium]|nr:hypothetical protein [Phycisphaerae bacterium]
MSRSGRSPVTLMAVLVSTASAGAWPPTVIDFDTYPDGSMVQPSDRFTTQYSTVGVEFTDGGATGPAPSGNPCSISPPNHAYATTIVAYFVDPCTGIQSATDYAGTQQDSCWAPGEGIDMYWYDANGNLLDHQFNSGGGNFVALSTPQPVIARLEMQCILQGIDNFTFSEPVAVLRGDMDCNGLLEIEDVEPFVLALINAPAYMAAYATCDIRRADMNCDRKEDGLDVQGFTDALVP